MKTKEEWSHSTQFKSFPDLIGAIQEDARVDVLERLQKAVELLRSRPRLESPTENQLQWLANVHAFLAEQKESNLPSQHPGLE